MNKTYTCLLTGSYYRTALSAYVYYTKGDSVELTAAEASHFADFFTENDTWKQPLSDEEVTTTGGAISYSKTFENASSANFKIIQVGFTTTASTMPTGAICTIDVYNTAGSVVETKSFELAQVASTTSYVYFTGSYLNDAASYKIYGTVPQASGSNYTVTIEASELATDDVAYVEITNNGLVSGVNDLDIQLKDADGDDLSIRKGIIAVSVASDQIGSFGAATLLNGVAVGTDGELIETADDQKFYLMSELDGDIDLSLTPTNAGTATVSILTVDGIPSDADTVEFGDDTYEFDTDGSVTSGNIAVDISTASNEDDVVLAFQTAFNTNTSYDVTAVKTDGTATETILTFATAVPTTGDTVTFGTEVYEFTTDGTTPLTAPTNIRIDMTGAGGSFTAITTAETAAQGFKYVFNDQTAYNVTATGAAAAITLTATDNYYAYNSLSTTTSITATATGTYEDTTFGGGTGSSTTGVAAIVTCTANKFFVDYNSLATTDATDTGSFLGWEDTTFGGGTGSSTTGVDPTSSYYLLVELEDGKKFVSEQLPYRM